MSKRKFDRYTLWLTWRTRKGKREWSPYMTCVQRPWPAGNPRKFLFEWVETHFPGLHWDRKYWMILGGDKVPAGFIE